MRRFLGLAVLSLSLTACAVDQTRPHGPTKPTHSEFFTSEGGAVMLQKDSREAFFVLNLSLGKPLPPDSRVEVEFENPVHAAEPFIVPASVEHAGMLNVRSPGFDSIQNKRSYRTTTKVFDRQGRLMTSHEQWIWFDVPPEFRRGFLIKITD